MTRRVRFAWPDAGEQLDAFAQRFPAAAGDATGRAFVARGAGSEGVAGSGDRAVRCVLPLVLPPARADERPRAYAARLPDRIGRQCVVLLQAGAAALGYWDEDDLLRHKATKRYVVRGSGKAQPKHLEQKGKSRYGSRLRLQNWRRLLSEVNVKLHEWWDELGAPEQVLFAIPVRARDPFFASEPRPPFAPTDGNVRRIPLHVHVPDHRELLRVRRWCAHGRLELPDLPELPERVEPSERSGTLPDAE